MPNTDIFDSIVGVLSLVVGIVSLIISICTLNTAGKIKKRMLAKVETDDFNDTNKIIQELQSHIKTITADEIYTDRVLKDLYKLLVKFEEHYKNILTAGIRSIIKKIEKHIENKSCKGNLKFVSLLTKLGENIDKELKVTKNKQKGDTDI